MIVRVRIAHLPLLFGALFASALVGCSESDAPVTPSKTSLVEDTYVARGDADYSFANTGSDGTDGVDGTNGLTGADGADDTSSTDGTDGIDATDGTDGLDGSTGLTGTDNEDGADTGTDGCMPNCLSKACGDDGCGGSCGTCPAGQTCDEVFGVCAVSCQPNCVGKSCGDDGCGGSCGSCAGGDFCVEGQCQAECTPDCFAKQCGGDGCGGSCGTCEAGYQCEGTLCKAVCTPNCIGKTCGDDGCGGSCGSCGAGQGCINGLCTDSCTPNCIGKTCGDDGCGGSCGSCGGGQGCVNGLCVDSCTPNCTGKNCGDDGCGGSCGGCTGGQVCNGGTCESPGGPLGDVCTAPFVISALPFSTSGDTGDASSDYGFALNACVGEAGSLGGASRDEVYSYTASANGTYRATITAAYDSLLWVSTTCADLSAGCLGADDSCGSVGGCEEQVEFTLSAGQTAFIVVDGYGNFSDFNGTYTLTLEDVSNSCTPNCTGKACGDDGCGGSCGSCGAGQSCVNFLCQSDCTPSCAGKTCGDDGCGGSCGSCGVNETCSAGTCAPVGGTLGDTCSNAFSVGALPFSASGSTAGFTPDYASTSGACPGESSAYGSASSDVVYAFNPPFSGQYTVTLNASNYDSFLYVVTDCADIANSCVGGDDTICSTNCTETVTATLTAGTTYYIVVDSWNTVSNTTGDYTLTVAANDDGGAACGGGCPPGQSCVNNVCAPNAGNGDTCGAPFVVGTLPFTGTGDTSVANADYSYGEGVCSGETSAWGDGSKDQAWAFVAPTAGTYTFEVDTTFDSTLYLVSDCSAIDLNCIVAVDELCVDGCMEMVTASLAAGQLVYLIVDGYSNFSDYSGSYTLNVFGP